MQHASTPARLSALAVAIVGVLAVGNAAASGFQIRENSIKSQGRALSGTTVAKDDATVAISNPAAMVNLDKTTVVANISAIDLNGDFSGSAIAGAPFAASTTPAVKALARPATGGNGGDPGDIAAVPSFAVVMPLSGSFEDLWIGFGVNAPYGLVTEWDADWVGRYNAVKSDVKIIDATLSAAWKVNDQFSMGVGFIFQRADVTLTNALDLGTAVCSQLATGATTTAGSTAFTNLCLVPTAPYKPGQNDGFFAVEGKDNGIGWTFGMQWAPIEKLTVGYAYKSEIDHELKGTVDFTIPANVMALPGMSTRFADGPGGAALTTPSTHTFSALYEFNDSFRMYGEFQRTGWSSLRNVIITRGDGTVLGTEDYHWSNSSLYSLGAEYDISPTLTLRGGIGRDYTPTHDANRTPRLPDNDRDLYSIGATWHATPNLSIDAAYMRVNLKDAPINSTSSTGARLTGQVAGNANVFGLGASYKF